MKNQTTYSKAKISRKNLSEQLRGFRDGFNGVAIDKSVQNQYYLRGYENGKRRRDECGAE